MLSWHRRAVRPRHRGVLGGGDRGIGVRNEAGACCKEAGGKCPIGFAKWDHPTWKELYFELDHPHYYAYAFESTEAGFVARAVGDIDCDGKTSTFELAGKIVDGNVELGEIVKTDPLE